MTAIRAPSTACQGDGIQDRTHESVLAQGKTACCKYRLLSGLAANFRGGRDEGLAMGGEANKDHG